MTLVKPLREILALVDFSMKKEDMGFKPIPPSLHQVITGLPDSGRLDQAKEYARELIQRSILKTTPVEMNCHQPMSDAMVQQFFKDAKKGMLIVDGIEHLSRQETFTSLALRAVSEGSCMIVMCGTKEAVQRLFAEDEGWKHRFASVFDMTDAAIVNDLADQLKQQETARIQEMLTVQNPIQPMRPLRLIPKPEK